MTALDKNLVLPTQERSFTTITAAQPQPEVTLITDEGQGRNTLT